MIDLEEIERKIKSGEITHADIYALIEEIRQLRKLLEKEEFNRRFGM